MIFKLSKKQKLEFFTKLHTLIQSGISIRESLDILRKQTRSRKILEIIEILNSDVMAGRQLCEGMEKTQGQFSPLEVNLVRVGEKVGKTDENLKIIAEYLEKMIAISRRLLIGMIYPFILVHALIFIPPLVELFTVGLLAYVKKVLIVLISFYFFVTLIFLFVKVFTKYEGVKNLYDRVLLCIPLLSSMIRKISFARFAYSFSAMYEAGLNVVDCLESSADACGNNVIAERIRRVSPLISQGQSLSAAFSQIQGIPPMALEMLAAGEKSGDVNQMLTKFAQYIEEQSDTRMKAFTIIIPIVLYFLIVIYIAYMVISFYVARYTKITNIIDKK